MKIFWFSFLLFGCSMGVFAQSYLINEGFESNGVPAGWLFANSFMPDTTYARNGKQSLKIPESGNLIYQMPLSKVGKIEFSLKARGAGGWNITVSTSTIANFDDELAWKKIETFKVDIAQDDKIFDTKISTINAFDRTFIRLSFEKIGEGSVLYVDDINVVQISGDVEAKIKSEIAEEKNRVDRERHFKNLLESANYDDARTLVDSYEHTYDKRIKTLSMLYDKTNILKVVSGTASALGSLNQLSNPTQYEEYQRMTKSLLPKLQPIDTLFFGDQVRNKIDNFFRKIENPLNIITGIGDLFTGGGISRIVDNFKGLITKGYSAERLEALGFKKDKLIEEQNNGMKLYNRARQFFDVIQEQNDKNMVLNKRIYEIYQNSKQLNTEILELYVEYLRYAKVVANKNTIDDLTKNQNYSQFDTEIHTHFSNLLGKKEQFDKYQITGQVKELDVLFQRIEMFVVDYDKLSNQMSSFYSDFKNNVDKDCPFRNVSANDQARWETEAQKILGTLTEVEQTFNTSYTKVDFNKE